MKRTLLALSLTALIGGCVVAPPESGYVVQEDAQEVLPPLPTFYSLSDCELAYGYGSCGTAPQVYARASLAAPAYASYWYMPYEYAGLTGALTYYHLAQPAVYVSSVPYRRYVAPIYVERYRVVTPVVVQRYHQLPPHRREVIIRQGPMPYYPPRGGVVGPAPHYPPPVRQPGQVPPPQHTTPSHQHAPAQQSPQPMPPAQRVPGMMQAPMQAPRPSATPPGGAPPSVIAPPAAVSPAPQPQVRPSPPAGSERRPPPGAQHGQRRDEGR